MHRYTVVYSTVRTAVRFGHTNMFGKVRFLSPNNVIDVFKSHYMYLLNIYRLLDFECS